MTRYNAETVPDLLGPGGPLAGDLAAYEDRPYQRELALEVARLLDEGGRLAAEAPTGIGKSLAYALPAAAWAVAGHGPVVISTHTKALQTQLLELEAPRLRRAVGDELRVDVLKGRANYLCRRRYEAACGEATGDGTLRLLERVRPWVESTDTGDLGQCGERHPRDRRFLQLRVASDPRFCGHADCSPGDGCFFKKARTRAGASHLLVVNHALLAIHLFGGRELLPNFEGLVVDEAHAFLRVALDHLTVSVGPGRAAALLERAPGTAGLVPDAVRSGEGASRLAALHRAMAKLETEARLFFSPKNGGRAGADDRRRYRDPDGLANLCPLPVDGLADALGMLQADARALGSFLEGQSDANGVSEGFAVDTERFGAELNAFRGDLEDLLHPDPTDRDSVAWKEWGGDDEFSLNRSPLEVGPQIAAALEEGPDRLVFTSATLAAGRDFNYFAREVGLEGDLPSMAYPSPFAFEAQALAVAVRRGPEPREPGWAETTATTLDGLLRDPARKTMALFTSYRDLGAVHEALGKLAADGAYEILAQGSGGTATDLLDEFRRKKRAVLLGTASFWEGVDLPGDALEVLVVTRLPFGVPTEPRYQARAERLEESGGNPFHELYLPEAVLRFKQGFGRLIRRRSDRGIVVVLDTRLLGKSYGRRFSAALPLPVTPVLDGPALVETAAAWWKAGAPVPPATGDSPSSATGDSPAPLVPESRTPSASESPPPVSRAEASALIKDILKKSKGTDQEGDAS